MAFDVAATIDGLRGYLKRDGYCSTRVLLDGGDPAHFVVEAARHLGELYIPDGCDECEPVIRTTPNRGTKAAPFDRPEAIGWHGDFATHEDRPELSLVYITRADPRGGDFGAWRLASVARVMAALDASPEGRFAIDLLSTEPLPFSYASGQASRWFRAIEHRDGRLGLRYYLPSIKRGCSAEYGEIPSGIAAALAAVERAADQVGKTVPTEAGSLLIASNWFALHDRVRQTISRTRENRTALLCFVAHSHAEAAGPGSGGQARPGHA